jgi:hypothetical protein
MNKADMDRPEEILIGGEANHGFDVVGQNNTTFVGDWQGSVTIRVKLV